MDQITNHPLYKVHTIDSAINSLLDFYRAKFIPLFISSFVMGIAMQYLSTRINIAEIQSITDLNELAAKLREFLWPMVIVSVTSLLFTNILQYFVIYNPLDAKNNFFACTVKSLKYYIPYLIIMVFLAIMGSFALVLGLLLFFVGIIFAAVYVMTIYLFILPVMMVEGPSIANTMSRTIVLSHRNFWSNIGWTAVFFIIILVLTTVLSALVLLPFTGQLFKVFSNPGDAASLAEITTRPLYIVLSGIVNALTLPLMPVFAAILYFNARAREDQRNTWQPAIVEEEKKVTVEDLYAKPQTEDDNEKQENS